ncbi:MAG: DUF11 domain-containing protein [Anaerolineae bacterium]
MKFRFTKLMLLGLMILLSAVRITSSVGAQVPEPQALFAHDNDKHTLIRIDTSTGLATVIGPTNFSSGASGMAAARGAVPGPGDVSFSEGTLFGLLRDDDSGEDWVVVVDVTTGKADKVIQTQRQIAPGRGIAFGPDGVALFVVEGPSGILSTVDTVTGSVSQIGGTGFAAASLEWDPDTASFFSITADNTLINISPVDGSSTIVGSAGSLGDPANFRASTLVRSPTGTWYTVNVLTGDLVTIDVNTGTVAAIIGNLGPDAQAPDGRYLIGATVFAPPALADLSVAKTDDPDPVAAGTGLTYTLTVTNNGPSDATGVVLTDTLPADVTFDSATPSQGSCSEAGGIVTCDIGNLAVGDTVSVEIVVTLSPLMAGGTTLTNAAAVAGNEPDPDLGNNAATEETGVIRQADLSVTKTDDPDPVDGGALITYVLNVNNAGPSIAEEVQVTDTLPAGATFESAAGDGWACSEAGGVVTCTRASLPVGDAPPITITAVAPTPDADTDITNNVEVSSSTPDPNPDNNRATASTRVVVPPSGTDKLTARVFIDYGCDGFFQGRLDIPLATVPVKVKFLVNGASLTKPTTPSGMVYFVGLDMSGGVEVSVTLPASYQGFPLGSCFNSPTTVVLQASDFAGGSIRHRHVDFRADVLD